VFHADDLGLNDRIDDGILRAFVKGVLTSSAVLANGPTAESAVKRLRESSAQWCEGDLIIAPQRTALNDPILPFDLGVHLNLTQGRPLTGNRFPAALLDDEGLFLRPSQLFVKLATSPSKWRAALQTELCAQIAWLFDQGSTPTHVNGHQYIELFPGVAPILPGVLAKFSIDVVRLPYERNLLATSGNLGIPTLLIAQIKKLLAARFGRIVTQAQLKHTDCFFGTAHAGRFNESSLANCLRLVTTERLIEVAIHPGGRADAANTNKQLNGWRDSLADRRPEECELLARVGGNYEGLWSRTGANQFFAYAEMAWRQKTKPCVSARVYRAA
jgi:chitin disaccharide deacetylase